MKNKNVIYAEPINFITVKTISMDRPNLLGIHFHNAIELVRVNKGEIKCIADNKTITLNEGNIALINRRVIHRLYSDTNSEITYMQIALDKYIHEEYSDITVFGNESSLKYKIFRKGELNGVFKNIESEIQNKASGYENFIKSHSLYIWAIMVRYGLIEDYSEKLKNASFKKLIPAMEYAKNNHASKISLDDAANTIHTDKYYFCKVFKKATGITYTDYVNFIRLDNAENLLLNSDSNIGEIAYQCGFASIQYFNRLFKKVKGITPKEYRKLHR